MSIPCDGLLNPLRPSKRHQRNISPCPTRTVHSKTLLEPMGCVLESHVHQQYILERSIVRSSLRQTVLGRKCQQWHRLMRLSIGNMSTQMTSLVFIGSEQRHAAVRAKDLPQAGAHLLQAGLRGPKTSRWIVDEDDRLTVANKMTTSTKTKNPPFWSHISPLSIFFTSPLTLSPPKRSRYAGLRRIYAPYPPELHAHPFTYPTNVTRGSRPTTNLYNRKIPPPLAFKNVSTTQRRPSHSSCRCRITYTSSHVWYQLRQYPTENYTFFPLTGGKCPVSLLPSLSSWLRSFAAARTSKMDYWPALFACSQHGQSRWHRGRWSESVLFL